MDNARYRCCSKCGKPLLGHIIAVICCMTIGLGSVAAQTQWLNIMNAVASTAFQRNNMINGQLSFSAATGARIVGQLAHRVPLFLRPTPVSSTLSGPMQFSIAPIGNLPHGRLFPISLILPGIHLPLWLFPLAFLGRSSWLAFVVCLAIGPNLWGLLIRLSSRLAPLAFTVCSHCRVASRALLVQLGTCLAFRPVAIRRKRVSVEVINLFFKPAPGALFGFHVTSASGTPSRFALPRGLPTTRSPATCQPQP